MNRTETTTTARAVFAAAFLRRIVAPLAAVVVVLAVGSLGFRLIGGGRWPFFECIYFASSTLTSVGYTELPDMTFGARLFATILMWTGLGVIVYATSTITAFLLEENLAEFLRERRMDKTIGTFSGHQVVCGAGRMGTHVLDELRKTNTTCVVIEQSAERVEWLRLHFPDIPVITGNATEEENLVRARIAAARGLIAVLPDDSDNMMLTVQARFLNPQITIVVRCSQENLVGKFTLAGANQVINPVQIGGRRIAGEAVRPGVVSFLDYLLHGPPEARVEEVVVGPQSTLCNQTLGEAELSRRTGLSPVALGQRGQSHFTFNAPPEARLTAGTVIIVIGQPAQVAKLRELCAG